MRRLVPIEAALWVLGEPRGRNREFALARLRSLDRARRRLDRLRDVHQPGDFEPAVVDVEPRWVRCARRNAAGADLYLRPADATSIPLEADRIVTDLPSGVRTSAAALPGLYRAFSANLQAGW